MTSVPITELPALMLSGNFPDEIVVQHNLITLVEIYQEDLLILEEEYDPDGNGLLRLRLKDFFEAQLSTDIPVTDNLLLQSKSYAQFSIILHLGNLLEKSFTLVKGGVASPIIDCENFLKSNFLTWKPQVKKVQYLDPQWLTYYNSTRQAAVYVQATYLQNNTLVTSQPVLLYNLENNHKYTINTKFDNLWQPFNQAGRIPYYCDVYIAANDTKLSYTQRYVCTDDYHEFNDLFCFENSLGGVDVIRFTGQKERSIENEVKSAYFRKELREYAITPNHSFIKSTGYFSNAYEVLWAIDFLNSINRYHYVNGLPVRILVKQTEAKDISGSLNAFEFTFSYASQDRYLNNDTVVGQLPSISQEFTYNPQVFDDIYVRVFGDQTVDGVKTFLQPLKANTVNPASGAQLTLNGLVVKEGGLIDLGEH